jgi:hypothetical protein
MFLKDVGQRNVHDNYTRAIKMMKQVSPVEEKRECSRTDQYHARLLCR